MSTVGIHIFRRDYRLNDNTSLIELCSKVDIVIPIFIFTTQQIKNNEYRSDNCVQFLCESLVDLNQQLKNVNSDLYLFYGDEFIVLDTLIKEIMKTNNLKMISFNKDMTDYSQKRDNKIIKICNEKNIEVINLDDITLQPLGTVLTGNGNMFTKFTPFYRSLMKLKVNDISHNNYKNFITSRHGLNKILEKLKFYITIDDMMKENGLILGKNNNKLIEHGGRENGLKILKNINDWKDYDNNRDELIYNTTHLSAFNKFGCISVREVFHHMKNKLGINSDLIRQMVWRDFFYNLSYLHPEIYKGSLNIKFNNIKWENDISKFKKWCNGETGFPVVDAAMRELNTTGYMHNRGRLIVSNFLVRLLHVDWRWGEKYFAKQLYDYDPAQNNFGWQTGAATTPTISRPLSQTILNPWIQSSNFDKDALYIKKWIPELKNVKPNDLHKWDIYCKEYLEKGIKYLEPIIDYKKEKEHNLALYKKYI